GGNVSFYNQNPDGPVYPTPTIGMVGILEDVNTKMTLDFKNEGDIILLIGQQHNDIASSEYLHKLKGVQYSPAPYFNLDEEYNTQQFVYQLIQEKKINSAHDLSEGGLVVALLESGFAGNKGFSVNPSVDIRRDAYWFGEAQGRVIVSVAKNQVVAILQLASTAGIVCAEIGVVTAGSIKVQGENWGNIDGWKLKYDTAIEKLIQ
ncbi:MAG: AIR synthase-related protein, partial [Sediminibacterium sp.]|nr:AIR synthase-related protein [Sediminibacterium sp.]